MFTGIIQSIGFIHKINIKENIYQIKTKLDLDGCKEGSSICCDGVCLTIVNIAKYNLEYIFSINIGEETIKRTNILNWKKGRGINLEKSLKVGDEISGHFVYGHIDLTLTLKKVKKIKNSWVFEFSFLNPNSSLNIKKFIVEKGSISVNGISLTISNVFKLSFDISVIPHTYVNTNLSILKENDIVNIEIDPLARYISAHYDN